jgi:hypothetical protein
VASKVAAHPSTIGYVNLADARKNGSFHAAGGRLGNGDVLGRGWKRQNHGGRKKKVATLADPADNGDVEAKGNSNCEETPYINGKETSRRKAPPSPWKEVTTSKVEKNYVICGFTYDLGLEKWAPLRKNCPNRPNR